MSIRRHLSYGVMVWERLFEISGRLASDPFGAYAMLKSFIPLLPTRIQEKVKTILQRLAEESVHIKTYLYEETKDVTAAELEYVDVMRQVLRTYVEEALTVISEELEKIGLMYQQEQLYGQDTD